MYPPLDIVIPWFWGGSRESVFFNSKLLSSPKQRSLNFAAFWNHPRSLKTVQGWILSWELPNLILRGVTWASIFFFPGHPNSLKLPGWFCCTASVNNRLKQREGAWKTLVGIYEQQWKHGGNLQHPLIAESQICHHSIHHLPRPVAFT